VTIAEFEHLESKNKRDELFKCCGSNEWVINLLSKFPMSSVPEIKSASDQTWFSLKEEDWKEAFTHHPKIGDMEALKKKFASTSAWAEGEQSAVKSAATEVLNELKRANEQYEKKFGYIFIVCATGKSADEMLKLLNERLPNSPQEEIAVAMKEQNKITHLRLDKLFA
jgi:2-oxo-4-hydroxy-4-carboxy-5-ureidoimidazoline decarboxylase